MEDRITSQTIAPVVLATTFLANIARSVAGNHVVIESLLHLALAPVHILI